MTTYDDLRVEYEAIRPGLEELATEVHTWLEAAAKELRLKDSTVSSRVKEVPSLLGKAISKQMKGEPWLDPLSEASDKIGLRVDVVLLADIERLVAYIEAAKGHFDEISVEDKRIELGTDQLGYIGVHIDVKPHKIPDTLDPKHAICEIQIRTHAQAAWAMACHDLVYKTPIVVPDDVKRQVNRLTALLELFDEGVANARQQIMSSNGYPLTILIGALEDQRLRFITEDYNRELTRQVVDGLLPVDDADATHALVNDIETFVEGNLDELRGIYGMDHAGADIALLNQPEAILVFFLLERDQFSTQEAWIKLDIPYDFLERLAIAWGMALPVPL